MLQRWIVTTLGKDRQGIVAGVTKILYQLGCNLEDSAMTRLEGEFTVMLIFSSSAAMSEERLLKAFSPLQRRLGLVVHLKPLTKGEALAPKKRGASCLISVYGADKPGIVYHMSEALSRAGANIIDVHTHRSTGRGASLYLTLLETELPRRRSMESLDAAMKQVAKRLGVEVSVRPSEPAIL